MDQASFLRELMNKTQRVKTSPFAVLSTSDFQHPEEAIKYMVNWFSKKTQRTVALLGLDENDDTNLYRCIQENKNIEDITERVSQKTVYVPGTLDFLSEIRTQKERSKHLVESIQKIESTSDSLFYYAGEGLHTTTINLSMMTSKVLVLMKPTTKSFMELSNYIKIFSKTHSNNELGIILDIEDEESFKEEANKIQELYWKQFKYYIEPVGFFDVKKLEHNKEECFERFNYDYMLKKTETKMFSESLENMFL